MKEYLDFIRELADLAEEIGPEKALGCVEYQLEGSRWRALQHDVHLPIHIVGCEYRIKPATTVHPGGEMPQHVSKKELESDPWAEFHSPFHGRVLESNELVSQYGSENAHKMAFDTAEKAKEAEKVMRGF